MHPARDRISRAPEMLMLGASAAVVLGIAFLSYFSGSRVQIAEAERNIAETIAATDALLLSTLKDAETGQRGFLLTGRDDYLTPYNAALRSIPELLTRLDQTTRSQPGERKFTEELKPLVAEKLSELARTIELRRANKLSEAMAIVETGRGKALMDQIRTACAAIDELAMQRSTGSNAQARSSAFNLRFVATAGSALLIVFLASCTFTVFRGMDRRENLIKEASAARRLLATTLSGIADGVIATDASCHITFINPAAQRLTGWSEPEATGVHVRQVFHIVNEDTRADVENPLEKAIARGEIVGLANHTNLISKSSVEIAIDDSAAPLRDEEGRIIGAVLVFRDITVRREAERRLRTANQELQQFVNSAAHDLRAPLGTVSAMAELLLRRFPDQLGGEGQELLGYISRGIAGMQRLLEDLVAFARASHFDPNAAPKISLQRVLDSTLDNLKSEIETAGANITFSALPEVEMQESHAVQLFQNLIGNALKYRGDGHPRVHLESKLDNLDWLISVADNGIGIEPEFFDMIFQPFKRLHGDELPGSGIGLATCAKILAGYGGRIWVESEAGKGSIFYFTIPSRKAIAGAAPAGSFIAR